MNEKSVKPISLKEQIAKTLMEKKAQPAVKPAPAQCIDKDGWPDEDYYGKVMPWNNGCGGSY